MQSTRTLIISDGGVTSALACVAALEHAASSRSALLSPERGPRRADTRGVGVPSAESAGVREGSGAARTAQGGPSLSESDRPIVWTPAFSGPTGRARLHAVEEQCELLGLPLIRAACEVDGAEAGVSLGHAGTGHRAEDESRMLMTACFEALRQGCSRVVWPVQFSLGAELALDAGSRAVDRALLISRLVSLEIDPSRESVVTVDPTYADFNDLQIADLVMDLDAPVETCWWWHAEFAKGRPDDVAMFRGEQQRWVKAMESKGWSRSR